MTDESERKFPSETLQDSIHRFKAQSRKETAKRKAEEDVNDEQRNTNRRLVDPDAGANRC